jgi:hypothetical protein
MDGREPEVRFNGSEYRSGLKPGRILSLRTGEADDPLSADVRIWRIRRDFAIADLRRDAAELNYVDSSSVTQGQIDSVRHQYELDWTEWPAHMGAPFYDSNGDGTYQPRFTGRVVNGVNVPLRFPEADEPGLLDADQVIWFVANDIRVDQPWTCPESGIEIQVTVWGYDRPDPVGDALFKSGRLIYKGDERHSCRRQDREHVHRAMV